MDYPLVTEVLFLYFAGRVHGIAKSGHCMFGCSLLEISGMRYLVMFVSAIKNGRRSLGYDHGLTAWHSSAWHKKARFTDRHFKSESLQNPFIPLWIS